MGEFSNIILKNWNKSYSENFCWINKFLKIRLFNGYEFFWWVKVHAFGFSSEFARSSCVRQGRAWACVGCCAACDWPGAPSTGFILCLVSHRHEHRETIREIRVRKHPTFPVPNLPIPSQLPRLSQWETAWEGRESFPTQRLVQSQKDPEKNQRDRIEPWDGALIDRGSNRNEPRFDQWYGTKPFRQWSPRSIRLLFIRWPNYLSTNQHNFPTPNSSQFWHIISPKLSHAIN